MMLAYTIQRFGNLLELLLCARAILSWFGQKYSFGKYPR